MKISVCMATYNGDKYVTKQIDSILSQLHSNDELIICDDCSTDLTISKVGSYVDRRLKLVKNSFRLGVVANYNKCIYLARNEIIFLADQDDIWMPDRVEKSLNTLNKYPKVTLVLSNAQLIDETDRVIKEMLFNFHGAVDIGIFRALKNILKNKYLGCAIAFRKDMTKHVLPIPSDVPMHDMWIGIINDIYGKTYYLDESLIKYRRHSRNLTSDRHAFLQQMVQWRYRLIKRLLQTVMK